MEVLVILSESLTLEAPGRAATSYDPNDLDEVECPRCGGTGMTGYAGDQCKLCKGEQRVKEATAQRFEAGRK